MVRKFNFGLATSETQKLFTKCWA